ncbi:hypothetical protein BC829DRAFT_424056 [Chytridium lagenaria]|nr:hypothetical protein BC829DRAFT_424056 [Chytridium lagenaria]
MGYRGEVLTSEWEMETVAGGGLETDGCEGCHFSACARFIDAGWTGGSLVDGVSMAGDGMGRRVDVESLGGRGGGMEGWEEEGSEREREERMMKGLKWGDGW